MRAIIDRAELLAALVLAQSVVRAITPKPVLKCVKLSTVDAAVELEATDMEVGLVRRMNKVQVERTGATCVSSEGLLDAIRGASGGTVSVDLVDDVLIVATSAARFRLPTLPTSDFPGVPRTDPAAPACAITAVELLRLIRQTAFAASDESTRYAMAGVLLKFMGKKALMAGTDGRRMAIAEAAAKGGDPKAPGWLLGKRLIGVAAKAFEEDDTIEFRTDGGAAVMSAGTLTVRGSMIEGQFPPYEDVMPKDSDVVVTVSTEAFADVLRQVAPFSADADGNAGRGGAKFTLSKKTGMAVSVKSDRGEAAVQFPCKVDGSDLEIWLAANLLADGVRAAACGGGKELTLHFTTHHRPLRLAADGGFQYVLMPRNGS